MTIHSRLIDHPSLNFDARPEGMAVDTLVLHYTGMTSAKSALARLTDRSAKVSAHYMVDEDGTVFRLVEEDKRAWHAGVSSWKGETDVNGRSIGIELVNPGHEFGYRPFPKAQMDSLVVLARDIAARHDIPPDRVLGHSDVAPERKSDPGELFDWALLAEAGVGLWPPPEVRERTKEAPLTLTLAEAQEKLRLLGYAVPRAGEMDSRTRAVLIAFQRHFRQDKVDGTLDGETAAILAWAIEAAWD
ncbi:MAG: N-acetylmuramoyl-L-alanine amidase [Alphaproteobacteria bacterium]